MTPDGGAGGPETANAVRPRSSTAPSHLAREKAYVRRIERRLIALRESGLLISPKDFALLLAWFDRGVPAELVIATLEDVFARTADRSEARRVHTLSYCRKAVERAWEERRAAMLGPLPPEAGTAKGGFAVEEVTAHLLRAAEETGASARRLLSGEPWARRGLSAPPASPEGARAEGEAPPARAASFVLGPESGDPRETAAKALSEIAGRIVELRLGLESDAPARARGSPPDLRGLEEALVALEAEALQCVKDALAAEDLDGIGREAEASLQALASRMSERARAATLQRLLDGEVRRRLGLPRYSLFTLAR